MKRKVFLNKGYLDFLIKCERISIADLSKSTGISARTLYGYNKSLKIPDVGTLLALSEHFNVSMEDLLIDEEGLKNLLGVVYDDVKGYRLEYTSKSYKEWCDAVFEVSKIKNSVVAECMAEYRAKSDV